MHGYDVFRPWSLKPAPCPDTCATPNVPLKKWYHDLASRYPELVKEETIGQSILGQPIKAFKLTAGARSTRDGSRPVTLFESTQHAREWISAEVNRRLFAWFIDHRADRDVKQLLQQNEVWFIPMMNPDAYDYTFTSAETRLWRKNLRDVNGDGVIDPNNDGVDLNRNWPEKWNYDLEGSSDVPASETYHGTAAASEPEVQAARSLQRRLKPRFLIDYHSFAQLILYPEGWQVETEATDAPLMKALAGDDDHPAVAGFDPDVSAELYTTNGDVTGDAYNNWGTQAFTVELDGGTGDGVGGTVDGPDSLPPGGFVFQDDETAVQAEFEKNLDFALDLVKSAARPDEPKSHLGNTAPDLVPSTFSISTGDPQTVEVNAKRSLGNVRVFWQVNGGRVHRGNLSEYAGGERYGKPGAYYHKLRGQVTGAKAGDSVQVWFGHGNTTSDPFTYTVKSTTGNPVLLMPAEDYTGMVSDVGTDPYPGPLYQDDYQAALDAAGISYDVYDVDANGRTAASALGVLSHYKAVIWETGEDVYVREPGQPGGSGTSKLARRRDPRHPRLPQQRRQGTRGGQVRAAGRLGPVPVQPARRPARAVLQEQPGRSQRQRRPAGPALQLRGGVQRLPAVLARRLPADRGGRRQRRGGGAAVPGGRRALRQRGIHGQRRGLRGESGQHLLVPDDVEHPAGRHLPAVREPAGDQDRPPAVVRPADGHALRVLAGGRRQLQAAVADGRPDRARRRQTCRSRRPTTPSPAGTTSPSRPIPSAWTTGRRSPTRTGTPRTTSRATAAARRSRSSRSTRSWPTT